LGRHHDEIKRLWVDENKTLPETMMAMAENFKFEPRKFNSAMKLGRTVYLKL